MHPLMMPYPCPIPTLYDTLTLHPFIIPCTPSPLTPYCHPTLSRNAVCPRPIAPHPHTAITPDPALHPALHPPPGLPPSVARRPQPTLHAQPPLPPPGAVLPATNVARSAVAVAPGCGGNPPHSSSSRAPIGLNAAVSAAGVGSPHSRNCSSAGAQHSTSCGRGRGWVQHLVLRHQAPVQHSLVPERRPGAAGFGAGAALGAGFCERAPPPPPDFRTSPGQATGKRSGPQPSGRPSRQGNVQQCGSAHVVLHNSTCNSNSSRIRTLN